MHSFVHLGVSKHAFNTGRCRRVERKFGWIHRQQLLSDGEINIVWSW